MYYNRACMLSMSTTSATCALLYSMSMWPDRHFRDTGGQRRQHVYRVGMVANVSTYNIPCVRMAFAGLAVASETNFVRHIADRIIPLRDHVTSPGCSFSLSLLQTCSTCALPLKSQCSWHGCAMIITPGLRTRRGEQIFFFRSLHTHRQRSSSHT